MYWKKTLFCKDTRPQSTKSNTTFWKNEIDVKGPLPSVTKNKYIVAVTDEYPRSLDIHLLCTSLIKVLSVPIPAIKSPVV